MMDKVIHKILLPKVDVIFKLLFGDERNSEILIDFLKSVLNLSEDEYEYITLEDTHLKRETVDDKLGIVDVKLKTKSGKIVHIEMQVLEQDDIPERVTYYNAKMLVTQKKSGDNKYYFQKTISIVIADFEIVANSPDKYHHKFQLNDIDCGVNFTDIIEINTLELGKVPAQSDNCKKHDWLQFLKAEREEEFEMLAQKSPVIGKAFVELKRLSQSEETQRLYEAREKALWAEQSRLRTVKNNALQEVVVNAFGLGLSNEQIASLTGMSVVDIEAMRTK
jgi:predicted transposase/invertase (TIGR01784 family)